MPPEAAARTLPPHLPSWTLNPSPGAVPFPCPPLPSIIHKNWWVGVFDPADSESGTRFARIRLAAPELAVGVAAVHSHCTFHSSTTTGPNGVIVGAFERSNLRLSERLGARLRKHRGKVEKSVHHFMLKRLSSLFRYFSGQGKCAYRCAM